MTLESSKSEIQQSDTERESYRRLHSNQIMLDLRHQVQHQERIIRSLIAERDGLTRELDSRLFLVEAQLRREQKHIEAVLSEKEHLITFQAMQIHSLKQLLSQVSENQNHYQRNQRSSKRSLSKRYSVALDEYMKDHCTVSRACPVIIQGENDVQLSKNMRYNRARSLPELRFKDLASSPESFKELPQNHLNHRKTTATPGQLCHIPSNFISKQMPFIMGNSATAPKTCCSTPSHDIFEDISSRRWISDCDSEHSDSLDSGISSPSIKSRNMHESFGSDDKDLYIKSEKNTNHHAQRDLHIENCNNAFDVEFHNHRQLDAGHQKPRRSSSIGNFINRTFSSSSSEKMKDNLDTMARRHSSFSAAEQDLDAESAVPKTRLINSTNKTFGTNHRSVTKPRDIKFKKLFKFKRRTEPDHVSTEDYMTV